MHVEDSYEGALLRMQRLEQAGIIVAPSPPRKSEDEEALLARVRDLEELATVACDENERLKQELVEARDLIVSLQRQAAMLESRADPTEAAMLESRADPTESSSFPAPEPAPPLDAHFGLDSPDDDSFSFELKRKRGGAIRYLVAAAAVGGIACVWLSLRPQARPQAAVAIASPAPPAPTVAVSAAPPIAPPATAAHAIPAALPTTAAPSPATSIPTAAAPQPSAPAAQPPAVATRSPAIESSHRELAKKHHSSRRHHHHAARKHHAASHHVASQHHVGDTNDPLGGSDL
ncbi:MAG: hypothetical protein ACHQ17_02065 [Polyangia bacterium]